MTTGASNSDSIDEFIHEAYVEVQNEILKNYQIFKEFYNFNQMEFDIFENNCEAMLDYACNHYGVYNADYRAVGFMNAFIHATYSGLLLNTFEKQLGEVEDFDSEDDVVEIEIYPLSQYQAREYSKAIFKTVLREPEDWYKKLLEGLKNEGKELFDNNSTSVQQSTPEIHSGIGSLREG